jgi:hypothetical protein
MKGMFIVIERNNIKGLQRWGRELQRREIPALITLDNPMLDSYPDVIKNLADADFEIVGGYNDGPFWNESYDFQWEQITRIKGKLESCTKKPMRVFHSKYFSYNEATLEIAQRLGVEYICARGTTKARATIYKPEEYDVKLISASNVPSEKMGTGSLCDFSLWCRTESPESFKKLLFSLTEDQIILIAQTHLSGVKVNWWNVYQEFFDANIVSWESLDEFAAQPIVMPNKEIPINTRVDYTVPRPKVPMEEEPNL